MNDRIEQTGSVPKRFWAIAAVLTACSGFAGAAAGAAVAASHNDGTCLTVVENALDAALATPSVPREWRWDPPTTHFDGMWMDDR